MPDRPVQPDIGSLLGAVLDSDPRIRAAFETLSRNGQVPVEQVEPVLGDTILNGLRSADRLDGRQDNHISRETVERIIGSVDGLSVGQRITMRHALESIPPEGIRLYPERVNRVVSSSLRAADANDDWQLTPRELRALGDQLGSQADQLIERPNLPIRSEPRQRQ